MSNETALVPANVYDIVEYQKAQFCNVLSTESISWDREKQFAIQALQANDFLNDTAWKNPTTLQNAIINIANIGISLNPALKHAYLVPRGGAVCLDVSFMGILHIAQKSGAISWGQAKIVYENDDYVNTGVDTAPRHEQKTFGDKGAIVGVYCTVKLPNGDYLTEEMDMAVIEKIKGASKSAKGPWKAWPEEMMRKAVVKRASKYWPACDRVGYAVDMLNKQEGNEERIETKPEMKTYTPDQKKYFDQLIENSDALGMYVFSCSFDLTDASSDGASIWISLLHSFEKGMKGRYGDIVKALRRSGFELIETYTASIEENLGIDDSAVIELISELDSEAINIISGKINNEMIGDFNRLVAENTNNPLNR